jgi:1-acyl-sn-glycerol-3-phosphate acyltransferase
MASLTAPPAAAPGETLLGRWARRAIAIPAFLLAFLALAALFPLLFPVALAVDAVRRRRLALTRALCVLLLFFAFEALGLASLFGLWLSRAGLERFFRFEWWWGSALLELVLRLYGMRLEVEGLEHVAPGPVLVFGNHDSVADVLLPAALVSGRAGIRLRYVAKLELVWDPCVDLAGHWLPNVFVRRGSADTPGDVARVQSLLEGLGRQDGVFMMPEGTRFTSARRARLLAGEGPGGPTEMAAQARRFAHLLPPRLGGLLGLFEKNPGADVVFLAHAGLEGVRTLADVWNGVLVGRTLRVEFWRRPWSSVPQDHAGRVDWILREWEELDAWVGRSRAGASGGWRPGLPSD